MKKDIAKTSRRRIVKSLAGAGVVGASVMKEWHKPVVNSVLLPAHAQTSSTTTAAPTTTVNTNFSYFGSNVSPTATLDFEDSSLYAKVIDTFVPKAHAGGGQGRALPFASIEVNGDTAEVRFRNNDNTREFMATVSTDGSSGSAVEIDMGLNCDFSSGGPSSVRLVGYTLGDDQATFEFDGGFSTRQFSIPLGSGSFGPIDDCEFIPQ